MLNITAVVEKENEFGQLKMDSVRLVDLNSKVAHTLTCHKGDLSINHCNLIIVLDQQKIGVRRLTPKECWRLMGFDDEDFERAAKVNSNAQLYKQAGNSIVVNVLEAIFKQLLGD